MRNLKTIALVLSGVRLLAPAPRAQDPLLSWNDGDVQRASAVIFPFDTK